MNEEVQTKIRSNNIEYSCEGCGMLLPKELIEELNKGKFIYCENCGAKNVFKQDSNLILQKIKRNSPILSPKIEVLDIQLNQSILQKKKPFIFKAKRSFSKLWRKIKRTFRGSKRKFNGRGYRHRGNH